MASCFQCDRKKSKSWFIDFKYNPRKDQAGDVRNILLIVATLIAAVTFQAGVNPPGGVWQDYTIRNRTLCAEKRAQGIRPDPSCYKSHDAFMRLEKPNSMFSWSLTLWHFPLRFLSLCVSHISSLSI